MKEFDLEKAKAGHPVCTRDGREARILCFDRIGDRPIVALVKEAGEETIFSYNKKGKLFSNDGRKCIDDLFMKAVKREAWINLYKDKDERLFPGLNFLNLKKKQRIEWNQVKSQVVYITKQ